MKPACVVGITGIFGSGKSSAAREFRELGAVCADADEIVREGLTQNQEIRGRVAGLFPEATDASSGSMDRKKLAAIIFSDASRRKKLEGVLHPYVLGRLREEVSKAGGKIAVLEVPLLYESGFDRDCDCSVVVAASEAVITARLSERGFSREEILGRIKTQMPLDEKIKRADFIVENTGDIECLKKQIKIIWEKISAMKGDS